MVKYVCEKCESVFDKKAAYGYHIIRITDCRNDPKKKKVKEHICNHCDKVLSRRDSLVRHLGACTKNPQNIKNNNTKRQSKQKKKKKIAKTPILRTASNVFYIISKKSKAKKNRYKIGIWSGSINELLSRYRTSLIYPVLYFFMYIDNAPELENKLKEELYDFRVSNSAGNKTEWIKMELHTLIEHVNKFISPYDNIEAGQYLPKHAKKNINVDETRT